jgi:uncharacterized RDD family membrane protein YckC
VERVLFGRRLGAFAIDALLLGIVLTFVHSMLVFLLEPFMTGTGPASDRVAVWWRLMPWGYHDPALPLALQAVIAGASALTVLGYFTWFEAHEGRTPGKRALELRVMRVDRQPVTYRETFGEDRQRASDKLAETVVVRA